MQSYLVTGANRGIGLEFCRQLAARNEEIFAVCRTSSDELAALDVTVYDGIDVNDPVALEPLALELDCIDIDVLIHNAGSYERADWDELDEEAFAAAERMFRTNALGPLRLTRAFRDNLYENSKIAIITSLMGSMTDNGSGGSYGYRMSKAAVNAAGVSLARDLASRTISVGMLHPGMVATDMTGGRGISVEESVRGLLARIEELGPENTGRFWHQDGRELPW
ncbi:MAG: SDR family oxidoreductase [Planctomycetota bacterium]|nr:SDR family oxidoreductase [Planctomycetota bacterium]